MNSDQRVRAALHPDEIVIKRALVDSRTFHAAVVVVRELQIVEVE